MIVQRALTEEERNRAESIYNSFVGINALAGNASGANIQILLAIFFGIGTVWVSAIGALTYLSYFVLPMGFYFAGKWGAGKSIRNLSWFAGIFCFIIASSALLNHGRTALFFTGLFFFYFFSSCKSSMFFPLQKNITTDDTVVRLLYRQQVIGASVGLGATLLITWWLTMTDNGIVLPLLFCIAGGLFFLSGWIMSLIPEPAILKKLAEQPVFPQVKLAWKDDIIRKQLGTGLILNLSLATMVAVNMVAAKNGCGINNAQSLLLSTVQIITTIGASWIFKIFTEHFGPRKMMIVSYPILWLLSLYWCFIPSHGCSLALLIAPFVLGGMATVFFGTALNSYFNISAPNELQIGGTFLIFTVTGGLVGLLGVLLNPLIFKITELFPSQDPMFPFRIYYCVTGLLSIPGIFSPVFLPVKYKEYREKQKNSVI